MGPQSNTEPDLGTKQQAKVEITAWKNNAAAALTLSFDDGYKETVKNCAHYLARHKLRATWNIPITYVGDIFEGQDVVSWSDIYEIAQQLGMEIASHSVNHLSLYTSPLEYLRKVPAGFYYASSKLAYLRQVIAMAYNLLTPGRSNRDRAEISPSDTDYEAAASKSEIDKQVPSQVTLSYVYPFGKCNRAYKDSVRAAGYTCARSTRKGYNVYEKIDFFDLRCLVWSKDTTAKEADGWIYKAMAKGAWLIETYHLVAEDNRSAYEWFSPAEAFQQHVAHLSRLAESNKVWVDTQQNVAKYMKQGLSSEVKILRQEPRHYILGLYNNVEPLSDQELTLRVEIPHQWHEIKVSQGVRPVAVRKDKNFILFNALPNTEDILIESTG
jgi:peptidoglycan/xylan/chitin deacetylase (PgdA/CDA1 family)